MARDADVVVVGGGVIGLAAAAALARAGREVLLLERNAGFGQESSSRNSGVIHAGLYTPRGSLKSRLCVAGREALYARCERLRIPHRRTGKLVVATTASEVGALERLLELGTANGAPGLEILEAAALRAREPALQALAAGLAADRVAACAGLDPDALGYRIHPCKGDYFALAPSAPLRLSTLVYPVPSGAGLGIHATLDLGGRIRFGPDAEYVERVDYSVDAAKAGRFAEAAGRYLPGLRPEWLTPDQAGVRSKLAGPGESFRDFVVAEESAAGLPGLVSCVGIESPGLTAAPAIAERVVELLR